MLRSLALDSTREGEGALPKLGWPSSLATPFSYVQVLRRCASYSDANELVGRKRTVTANRDHRVCCCAARVVTIVPRAVPISSAYVFVCVFVFLVAIAGIIAGISCIFFTVDRR